MPQSPFRPRISVRDILPVVIAGGVAAVLLLGAELVASSITGGVARPVTAASIASTAAMALALAFVLAGMQGRADELTIRHAVTGWLRFAFVAAAVLLIGGQTPMAHKAIKASVTVAGALGVSLLLYRLRRPRG